MITILGTIGDRTILDRGTKFQRYVCVKGYNPETNTWDFGNYFETFQDVCICALQKLGPETPVNPLMMQLSKNYEIAATAEYIRENYEVDGEEVWYKAYDVRERMADDEEYVAFESKYVEEVMGANA